MKEATLAVLGPLGVSPGPEGVSGQLSESPGAQAQCQLASMYQGQSN